MATVRQSNLDLSDIGAKPSTPEQSKQQFDLSDLGAKPEGQNFDLSDLGAKSAETRKPGKRTPVTISPGWQEQHPYRSAIFDPIQKYIGEKPIKAASEFLSKPRLNVYEPVKKVVESPAGIAGTSQFGPLAGAVTRGAIKATASAAEGFSSITNGVLMLGLPMKVVPWAVKAIASGTFGIEALADLRTKAPEAWEKLKNGDIEGAVEAAGQIGIDLMMVGGAGKAAREGYKRAQTPTAEQLGAARERAGGPQPEVRMKAEQITPETRAIPEGGRQVRGLLPPAPGQPPPEERRQPYVGAPGGTVIMGNREYTITPAGEATEVIRGRGHAGLLGPIPTRLVAPEMPPTTYRPAEAQKRLTGLPQTPSGGVMGRPLGEEGGIRPRGEQTITGIAKKGGKIRPPVRPEARVYGAYHDLPPMEELSGYHPDTIDVIRSLVSTRLNEIADIFAGGSEQLMGAKTGSLLEMSPEDYAAEGYSSKALRKGTTAVIGKIGGYKEAFLGKGIKAPPGEIARVIKTRGKSQVYQQVKDVVTRQILDEYGERLREYEEKAREREADEQFRLEERKGMSGEEAAPADFEFGGKEELPPMPERPKTPPESRTGEEGSVTMGMMFIPGLDTLVEKEVLPIARSIAETATGLGRALMHTFFPRIGVPKQGLDILYGMKGARDKAMFLIQARMEKAAKDFSKMPQAEQVDFIDRYKEGRAQGTPELQHLDIQYRDLENQLYYAISEFKPDLPFKQNHFRVMWKTIPGDINVFRSKLYDKMTVEEQRDFLDRYNSGTTQATPELERYAQFYRDREVDLVKVLGRPIGRIAQVTAPFRRKPILGSQTFKHKSTLANMSEGMGVGGEPWTFNPERMMEMAIADDLKFVTARRMWGKLKDAGMIQFVKEGKSAPEGKAKFDDPIAGVYFPVKGKGMVHAGDWYVEENVARLLNNFVSRDLLRDPRSALGYAGRPMMWLKNQMTAFELGFSAFHLTFEGLESVGSDVGLGLRKIGNLGLVQRRPGAIGEGIKTIAKAPLAPFGFRGSTYKTGAGLIKYVKDPVAFRATPEGQALLRLHPDLDQIINDMFGGGARLAIHEDYKLKSIDGFKQAVADVQSAPGIAKAGPLLRGIFDALPALNNLVMMPLFEKFIPRLKAGMFVKEFSTALLEKEADLNSGKITRPELARKTWDFVEDRLGEMNFDNLFWNRTLKTALQMTLRSVTWKWGNLRASGGALPEQAGELVRAFQEKRIPQLEPKLAWLLGMSALTATMGTLIQTAYTGKAPQSVKDLVYPRMDKEDDSQRFSMPTYWRDIVSVTHDWAKYISSSLSSEFSRTAELWRNADFYNNEIVDPDDPMWLKAFDVIGHYAPIPFSVTSGIRLAKEGEGAARAIPGAAGFTKAPGYITQSKALLRAREEAQKTYPRAPRPKSLGHRSAKRAELARVYEKDEDQFWDQMNEALDAGEINDRDWSAVLNKLGKDPLVHYVTRINAREAIDIYVNDATEEEREKLDQTNVIGKKIKSSSFEGLSVKQKDRLRSMLNSLGWDLPLEGEEGLEPIPQR